MIEAKVTNPQDIKLAITVEHPIGVWREIRKRIGEGVWDNGSIRYYSPVSDFLAGIAQAINLVEEHAQIADKPDGGK